MPLDDNRKALCGRGRVETEKDHNRPKEREDWREVPGVEPGGKT